MEEEKDRNRYSPHLMFPPTFRPCLRLCPVFILVALTSSPLPSLPSFLPPPLEEGPSPSLPPVISRPLPSLPFSPSQK